MSTIIDGLLLLIKGDLHTKYGIHPSLSHQVNVFARFPVFDHNWPQVLKWPWNSTENNGCLEWDTYDSTHLPIMNLVEICVLQSSCLQAASPTRTHSHTQHTSHCMTEYIPNASDASSFKTLESISKIVITDQSECEWIFIWSRLIFNIFDWFRSYFVRKFDYSLISIFWIKDARLMKMYTSLKISLKGSTICYGKESNSFVSCLEQDKIHWIFGQNFVKVLVFRASYWYCILWTCKLVRLLWAARICWDFILTVTKYSPNKTKSV